MKTVASLKQFARENGIRIPAGSLKGQIIDIIEKSFEKDAQKETEEKIQDTNEAGAEKDAHPALRMNGENAKEKRDMPLIRRANAFASQSPAKIPGVCPVRLNDTQTASGVLEIQPEGYGFLRRENFLPGKNDVYISVQHIKRFNLRNGDFVEGSVRPQRENDKYAGLTFVSKVNGGPISCLIRRAKFDSLTPVYATKRMYLEKEGEENDLSVRFLDLIAPIGKGQRGMIVSPPKAGKTTLLKLIAKSILKNNPEVHLITLLIDERPEEVTDIKREVGAECVYSTFDERPENHVRLSEMTLERAKRLVEAGKDVVILMDSITRLARAYNLVIPPTGRSLSGGLDPGALHKPKRFFGSARAIENGGSLTILATALIETGSRMDDIIYEEFKGTGNMEVHLDRKLSEKRIFPAVDLLKSGTRKDDLLMDDEEKMCAQNIRKLIASRASDEMMHKLISLMEKTISNKEFARKMKLWVEKWQREGYHLG
ncbi:MAG: transcription termination factor Rho [Clostridia bacterium]|nr:transcription termination factor Rho [Clostridia bacterium]